MRSVGVRLGDLWSGWVWFGKDFVIIPNFNLI